MRSEHCRPAYGAGAPGGLQLCRFSPQISGGAACARRPKDPMGLEICELFLVRRARESSRAEPPHEACGLWRTPPILPVPVALCKSKQNLAHVAARIFFLSDAQRQLSDAGFPQLEPHTFRTAVLRELKTATPVSGSPANESEQIKLFLLADRSGSFWKLAEQDFSCQA